MERPDIDDLELGLQSRVFVDYFNVFLSLPVFPQKMFYNWTQHNFEFDVDVDFHSHQSLDTKKLMQWIVDERLCHFWRSHLYADYKLNCKLRQTDSITDGPIIDAALGGKAHIDDLIGHAVGMCRFREFLNGTAGDTVLQFWIDVELFKDVTKRFSNRNSWHWREIQLKYFTSGGLFQLKENSMWHVLQESFDINAKVTEIGEDEETIDLTAIDELQEAVFTVLKEYWLPKFIIHQTRRSTLSDSVFRKNSQSTGLPSPTESNTNVMQPDEEPAEVETDHPEDIENPQNRGNILPVSSETLCSMECIQERNKHEIMHDFLNSHYEYLKGVMPDFSADLFPLSVCAHREEVTPESTPKFISDSDADLKESKSSESKSDTDNEEETFPAVVVKTKSDHFFHSKGIDNPMPRVFGRSVSELNTNVQEAFRTSRYTPLVTPILWKFALERSTISKEAKIFTCSLASDQITGGPFKAFLEKTADPSVIKFMHFWCDSLMYLSTKDNVNPKHYDRVLLRQARRLILNYLKELAPEHVCLSQPVVDGLLRLLPVDKGDHLLRHAQDTLRSELDQAWEIYNKVDILVFKKTCLVNKELEIIQKTVSLNTSRKKELIKQVEIDSKAQRKQNKNRSAQRRKLQQESVQYLYTLDPSGTLSLDEKFEAATVAEENLSNRSRPRRRSVKLDQKYSKSNSGTISKLKPTPKQGIPIKNPAAKKERRVRKEPRTELECQNSQTRKILIPNEEELNSKVAAAERRMWRALQITLCISRISCEEMPDLEKLLLSEVEFDWDVYGSLHMKPIVVILRENPQRRNYLEVETPKMPEADEAAITQHVTADNQEEETITTEEVPQEPAEAQESEPESDERIPRHLRLFRHPTTGKWIQRPRTPPYHFLQLLRDPVQREFFRRFLLSFTRDTPLQLWESVEKLQQTADPQTKQHLVAQISRKFFQNKTNFEALDCQLDALVQLTKMDKITAPFLVSAQAVIAKDMEVKWFREYLETFPEVDSDQEEQSEQLQVNTKSKPKKSKKKRATSNEKYPRGVAYMFRRRERWKFFARSVNGLIQCLWNPQICERFIDFLYQLITVEYQKHVELQQNTPRSKEDKPSKSSKEKPLSVKKNIQDKVIDVTRLPRDVRFLCEVERYLKLCDDATAAALAGAYDSNDEALVTQKAAVIRECFTDSSIEPRVQINASPEAASMISKFFCAKMVDRTLFHRAKMEVFPHILFLWQKFIQELRRKTLMTGEVNRRYWATTHDTLPVDFFNLTAKKITEGRFDFMAGQTFNFSLSSGLKLYVPPAGVLYSSIMQMCRRQSMSSQLDQKRAQQVRRQSLAAGSKGKESLLNFLKE